MLQSLWSNWPLWTLTRLTTTIPVLESHPIFQVFLWTKLWIMPNSGILCSSMTSICSILYKTGSTHTHTRTHTYMCPDFFSKSSFWCQEGGVPDSEGGRHRSPSLCCFKSRPPPSWWWEKLTGSLELQEPLSADEDHHQHQPSHHIRCGKNLTEVVVLPQEATEVSDIRLPHWFSRSCWEKCSI